MEPADELETAILAEYIWEVTSGLLGRALRNFVASPSAIDQLVERETAQPAPPEYTPYNRQLVSHEAAVADEFEQALLADVNAVDAWAEAWLSAPTHRPQTILMSQRDFDDIRKWQEESVAHATVQVSQNREARRRKKRGQPASKPLPCTH